MYTATASRPVQNESEECLLERFARERDPELKEELAGRFLPLARKLARRYSQTSEPFDDLFQVAAVGLLAALDRYDPARGRSFKSFAVPTILGELRRHFRDSGWSVHVPRVLQERSRAVEGVERRLARESGRSPTIAQLAAAMGLSREETLEAIDARLSYRARSLDASAGDGSDETLVQQVGAEDGELDHADDRVSTEHAMACLSTRDRLVVRLRFEEDLSQSEIGERLGISQMHVSRLLRRSLDRMGILIGSAGGSPAAEHAL
jgi:RNA polymerase sigma-B factor